MLSTNRLDLVPIAEEHAPLVVELDSDPAVKRFIDGGKATTLEQAEDFVASSLGHRWVAFTREGRAFVGWFGLAPSGAEERELGYRLGRAHWGQGFATEGAIALRDFAFAELGVERLWAQTMTINTASRRVLEKTCLQFVRQFFHEWPEVIEGSEHGDIEYELRRPRP